MSRSNWKVCGCGGGADQFKGSALVKLNKGAGIGGTNKEVKWTYASSGGTHTHFGPTNTHNLKRNPSIICRITKVPLIFWGVNIFDQKVKPVQSYQSKEIKLIQPLHCLDQNLKPKWRLTPKKFPCFWIFQCFQIISRNNGQQKQKETNLAITLVSIVLLHILCNALRVILGVLVVVHLGKHARTKYKNLMPQNFSNNFSWITSNAVRQMTGCSLYLF